MERPCELCEAARITPWFYEDDECWVAECEACYVPMVVWRRHDPDPGPEARASMLARLGEVMAARFPWAYYVDDRLRSIPEHWHAHARPKSGHFSGGAQPASPR
jgi:hypothetical protein